MNARIVLERLDIQGVTDQLDLFARQLLMGGLEDRCVLGEDESGAFVLAAAVAVQPVANPPDSPSLINTG